MTIVGTISFLVGTFLDKIFSCKTSRDDKKGTPAFSMVTMKIGLFTKVLVTFLFIGGLTEGIVG